MFKGLRHPGFMDGAQKLPLFIPLVLDVLQASPFLKTLFIDTCCILPNPRHLCTVTTLPNLWRLHVTSNPVPDILRLMSGKGGSAPPHICQPQEDGIQ